MSEERLNLLGEPRDDLEAFFASIGEKAFRARQVMKWIYRRGEADFEQMTDLGKVLRSRLKALALIEAPQIMTHQRSADGTRKWMLSMGANQGIEMVFIPEPNRGTLCISSQVGCALDCSFCSTAQQGFNRNLTSSEILGQLWLARNELQREHPGVASVISNVVFMGMGEPLANYRSVVPAISVMVDDLGFQLSRRRVTLSTSGLVPQINRLREDCNVALAVSLHAADDGLRNELVPINRRHPIKELLSACWRYAETQKLPITFEYVMLEGVNDGGEHARRLARLLRGKPAKVNLIPFNAYPGTRYRCSQPDVIERFWRVLNAEGVLAMTRRTRGDDIDAACGQLVGKVKDLTRVRLGKKMNSITV